MRALARRASGARPAQRAAARCTPSTPTPAGSPSPRPPTTPRSSPSTRARSRTAASTSPGSSTPTRRSRATIGGTGTRAASGCGVGRAAHAVRRAPYAPATAAARARPRRRTRVARSGRPRCARTPGRSATCACAAPRRAGAPVDVPLHAGARSRRAGPPPARGRRGHVPELGRASAQDRAGPRRRLRASQRANALGLHGRGCAACGARGSSIRGRRTRTRPRPDASRSRSPATRLGGDARAALTASKWDHPVVIVAVVLAGVLVVVLDRWRPIRLRRETARGGRGAGRARAARGRAEVRARARASRSSTPYRQRVERAPDWLWTATPTARVTYSNAAELPVEDKTRVARLGRCVVKRGERTVDTRSVRTERRLAGHRSRPERAGAGARAAGRRRRALAGGRRAPRGRRPTSWSATATCSAASRPTSCSSSAAGGRCGSASTATTPPALDRERTVLQIAPDTDARAGAARWPAPGFALALDGFDGASPLLEHCGIVKVARRPGATTRRCGADRRAGRARARARRHRRRRPRTSSRAAACSASRTSRASSSRARAARRRRRRGRARCRRCRELTGARRLLRGARADHRRRRRALARAAAPRQLGLLRAPAQDRHACARR